MMVLQTLERTNRRSPVERPISPDLAARIMNEWQEECKKVRDVGNRSSVEELDNIVFVIAGSFPLNDGVNPADFTCALCERVGHAFKKARQEAELDLLGIVRPRLYYDLDRAERVNANGHDGRRSLESYLASRNVSEEDIISRMKELVPPELLAHYELSQCGDSMFWNYPVFAGEILKTARIRDTGTRQVIKQALENIGNRNILFETFFGPAYEKRLMPNCLTLAKPKRGAKGGAKRR